MSADDAKLKGSPSSRTDPRNWGSSPAHWPAPHSRFEYAIRTMMHYSVVLRLHPTAVERNRNDYDVRAAFKQRPRKHVHSAAFRAPALMTTAEHVSYWIEAVEAWSNAQRGRGWGS